MNDVARPQEKRAAHETGQKILDYAIERYGSIAGLAKAAGKSEPTVRRLIFRPPSRRVDLDTVDALVGAGVPRQWLVEES